MDLSANLPVPQLFRILGHLPQPLFPTATCMRSEETKLEQRRTPSIMQRSTAMGHLVHGARQIRSLPQHLVISMLLLQMALSISMEDEVLQSNMRDKIRMGHLAHGLPRIILFQPVWNHRSWQLPTASFTLLVVRPTAPVQQHIPIKLPQPRSTLMDH